MTDRPTKMRSFSNDSWRADEPTERQLKFLKFLLAKSKHSGPYIDLSKLTKGDAADYIEKFRRYSK